ncbi:MAG: hypothetical protein RL540_1220 [Actinomycetota bacterium]|jgi:hypothetical protein
MHFTLKTVYHLDTDLKTLSYVHKRSETSCNKRKMPKLKRILWLFLLIMSLIGAANASSADVTPTMVIMDTALDTSIPEIRENLVYEVCILDWNSCPNGRDYMEGPGASTMPKSLINLNGFSHGTQMTSAALKTYPKLRFIFIRIIANSSSGARLSTSEGLVARALDWVLVNKDRFNIVSVGLAQSHHRLWNSRQYCPVSLKNNDVIRKLYYSGVPLFVASGNDNDKERVSWPACIPESMAVSAITNQSISRYSNFDRELSDFAAVGEMRVQTVGGGLTNASGTSIATQVMAALWTQVRVEFPTFTFQETFDFLVGISKSVQVGTSTVKWVSSDAVNLAIFRYSMASRGLTSIQIAELERCAVLQKWYSGFIKFHLPEWWCAK